MIRKTILILSVFIFASAAFGQAVYTPEKGTAERKAILDTLRVPVERDLKQKIVFVADHFSVSGNWAFVSGEPQSADGVRPDYSNTKYAEAVESDAFDNNFFALIKRTSGKWKVVTYLMGCTDVCYLEWPRQYKAPKAIFPYTE